MRIKPAGTLNHNEHDFLVELCEVDWRVAAKCVGWQEDSARHGQSRKLMQALGVAHRDDVELNMTALKEEAIRRGYGTSICYYMYDGEPEWQTLEELGQMPARFVSILPRTS